jgi:peptide/nickel transport system substrate-binding protein
MISGRRNSLIRRCVIALLLIAAAIVVGGCGSDATADGPQSAGTPQRGGQVVLGMDQEPPCLNTYLICGGMAAAGMMAAPMWDSFIAVDDSGTRFPLMATEIPTTENGGVVFEGGKMTVRMGIRSEAAWSDGKPVTCDDMVFTWKTMMDDRWQIGSRLGWDQIESITCPTSKKMVVKFSKPYAPYVSLVGAAPLPKHDIEGKDFNTYLNAGAPVTSGPFTFGYWKRNVEYVLTRNPKYWNRGTNDLPYLDSLKYTFIKDTNTMKVQLRTGEVDWINPPPDTSLVDELKSYPRAKFQSIPGGFWEHFAFNTSVAPTNDVNVRKAIAHTIDRKELTEVVLRGQTEPLNSTLLPAMKDFYIPAWEQYTFDPKKAASYLEQAGYQKNGTYFEKDGKPLTVSFKTTAGNALREKVAQLLQQKFKNVGIRLEIETELPQVFFAQTLPSGKFQTGEWAFGSSVDPTQTSLFSCDQVPSKANNFSGSNNYRWCNEEATRLLKLADVTPDLAKRAAALKDVQRIMAEEIPLLPLYQRPETVAYTQRVQNIRNNALGGQLWNVAEWWVTQ